MATYTCVEDGETTTAGFVVSSAPSSFFSSFVNTSQIARTNENDPMVRAINCPVDDIPPTPPSLFHLICNSTGRIHNTNTNPPPSVANKTFPAL